MVRRKNMLRYREEEEEEKNEFQGTNAPRTAMSIERAGGELDNRNDESGDGDGKSSSDGSSPEQERVGEQ